MSRYFVDDYRPKPSAEKVTRPKRKKTNPELLVEAPSSALNPTPEDVTTDTLVQKTVPGFKIFVTELVEEAKLEGVASDTRFTSLAPQTSDSDSLKVPVRQDRRRRAKNDPKVKPQGLGVVPEERQVIIVIPELVEFPKVVDDSVVNVPDAPSTVLAGHAPLGPEAETYIRRGRRRTASYSTARSHSPPGRSIFVP